MKLPMHVGIIPDGNRRWARKQGVSLYEAYIKGLDNLISIIDYLLDKGVKYVTVYAMSMDNCRRRSKPEILILKKISRIAFDRVMNNWRVKNGITRVIVIGNPLIIGKDVYEMAKKVMRYSRWGRDSVLTILYCYSGSWEVSRNMIGYTPPSLLHLPALDLVIRTGGYPRLSGFLPLINEYAELYSTKTLWPELSLDEVEEALNWYSMLPKNFGK